MSGGLGLNVQHNVWENQTAFQLQKLPKLKNGGGGMRFLACSTSERLKKKTTNILKWPSQSSDVNLTEVL